MKVKVEFICELSPDKKLIPFFQINDELLSTNLKHITELDVTELENEEGLI